MQKIKAMFQEKRGNTTPLTIALVLGLLFLICAISEFFRLSIIAYGVRNSLQSAVISVATTNYDEVYNGLREGYSGGYWLTGENWEENLDYGDIYEQLDELLGTESEGSYHVKETRSGYEYRLSGLSVDIENVRLRPGTTTKNLEVSAKIRLENPLSFGQEALPPVQMQVKVKSTYMPKFEWDAPR